MKHLFSMLLAVGCCFLFTACVSTYSQPLSSANSKRDMYVEPHHVHYYKDRPAPYGNRYSKPGTSHYGYVNYGNNPPPPNGKPGMTPPQNGKPGMSQPPQNGTPGNPPNGAKPSNAPNNNVSNINVKCYKDSDCPNHQKCEGATVRSQGVCR